MKIPKNQLKENQYTSGGEYLNTSNNSIYSGYYWEANGRYFIGKTFSLDAIELKKINTQEINKLNIINKFSTNTPKSVSEKITSSALTNQTTIVNIPKGTGDIRYFYKPTNVTSNIIKEVSQDTFNNIKLNPIYKTLAINSNSIFSGSAVLNEADKEFQGLKTFLGF